MAVKSLYFKNVTTNGALSLQDGGTAPTAAITTTGWTVAKNSTPNYSLMAVGTKATTFATTEPLATPSFTAASCWRSENPFLGIFANTSWSLAFRIRAVSSSSSQTGAVRCRIWKSSTAAGTGATQLSSAVLVGTTTAVLSTTASGASTVTWSPGVTINLVNEYLWVQCEWSIIVAGGANQADAVFYVESLGLITTPDFVASVAGTGALTAASSTLASTGIGSSRGTSVITSAVSTLAGTGTVVSPSVPPRAAVSWIELSGVQAVVTGSVTGTGVLNSVSTTIVSTGIGLSTGTGTLPSVVSTLVAPGLSKSIGTGVITPVVSTLVATGLSVSTGTGALSRNSTLAATGLSISNGTGVLPSVVSTLIATGLSVSTGIGVLVNATAVIISIDANLTYLYPDSDIVIGGWTDQANGTINLYQAVDEATANDTDYVQSSVNPSGDIIRFRMSDPTTGVGVPFNVNYRYGIIGVGAGCTITARLKQGSTTIKSWAHIDAALTLKTVSQPLSAGELAGITDFNDLFVEFEAGP